MSDSSSHTANPPQLRFLGYRRADGSAGTRNVLLVISITGLTGPAARRIARALPGAVLIDMPYGAGHMGADKVIQDRVLSGLVTHPNVGAALVVGGDQPKVDFIANVLVAAKRPHCALTLDECGHDALTLADRGLRAGALLAKALSGLRRESLPIGDLSLGFECGRSDPSSGLAANPVLGLLADRLVDSGATVMFGESIEWLGAEDRLAQRAVNPQVREAIVHATQRREQLAVDTGLDLIGNNPGPTNIEAGLSSIEEKALGGIVKSGSRAIQSVLQYGQRPLESGLHAMDAPAYAPESLTGFVAAGTSLLLFTTGVGNSYVNSLAPTIKMSGNPQTAARLQHQLDFECAGVFTGRQSLQSAADALLDVVIDVASGTRTYGEILGEDGISFARFGETL